MPSHAQRELAADPSVLRTIVRQANECLGLYASVARPGTVAVGEPVTCS
jgi:MOSC domain-containing protein